MSKPHKDTFTRLILPALDACRAYSRKLTRCPDDADELWAITAERCWRYRETFDASGNARAWVAAIMRRQAIDMAQPKRAQITSAYDPEWIDNSRRWAEEPSAEEQIDEDRRADDLHAAIDDLPPLWRDATEKVLAGWSHDEIAESQGTGKATIGVRVFRSRNLIRERLAA